MMNIETIWNNLKLNCSDEIFKEANAPGAKGIS